MVIHIELLKKNNIKISNEEIIENMEYIDNILNNDEISYVFKNKNYYIIFLIFIFIFFLLILYIKKYFLRNNNFI